MILSQYAKDAIDSGTKLNVTTVKFGTGTNYVPTQATTGLSGSILWGGPIANLDILSEAIADFLCVYPQYVDSSSVEIGEIALYTNDDHLYAIACLPYPIVKSVDIRFKMHALCQTGSLVNGLQTTLNWSMSLPRLDTYELLPSPQTTGDNAVIINKGLYYVAGTEIKPTLVVRYILEQEQLMVWGLVNGFHYYKGTIESTGLTTYNLPDAPIRAMDPAYLAFAFVYVYVGAGEGQIKATWFNQITLEFNIVSEFTIPLDSTSRVVVWAEAAIISEGMNSRGTYNPSITNAYPVLSVVKGDYFISTGTATINGTLYYPGDWMVYQGQTNWYKLSAGDAVKLNGRQSGNDTDHIPISNGIINTNLNSDLLDDKHLAEIMIDVVNTKVLNSGHSDVADLALYSENSDMLDNHHWYEILRLLNQGTTETMIWSTNGTYNWTIPENIDHSKPILIDSLGAGGGSGGLHDNDYGTYAIPGGPGGGIWNLNFTGLNAINYEFFQQLTVIVGKGGTQGGYAGKNNVGYGLPGESTKVSYKLTELLECTSGELPSSANPGIPGVGLIHYGTNGLALLGKAGVTVGGHERGYDPYMDGPSKVGTKAILDTPSAVNVPDGLTALSGLTLKDGWVKFTWYINTQALAGLSTLYKIAGTYYWTAPIDGPNYCIVSLIGGGGQVYWYDTIDGSNQGRGHSYGGGGGGYIGKLKYLVIPGKTYKVIVGAGGTGGQPNSTIRGTSGQVSSFNEDVAAFGGLCPVLNNTLTGPFGGSYDLNSSIYSRVTTDTILTVGTDGGYYIPGVAGGTITGATNAGNCIDSGDTTQNNPNGADGAVLIEY
jgi:hypothetical protein